MPDNAMCGMPERLRVCVEKCGEFINNENMNQSLFVFLSLHVIEGGHQFRDTLYIKQHLITYLLMMNGNLVRPIWPFRSVPV